MKFEKDGKLYLDRNGKFVKDKTVARTFIDMFQAMQYMKTVFNVSDNCHIVKEGL